MPHSSKKSASKNIATLEQERLLNESILSSMAQGILALDHEKRIIKVNDAVWKLLGTPGEDLTTHAVDKITSNEDLNEFILRVFKEERPIEAEIIVVKNEPRHIRCYGRPLTTSNGEKIGILVVLYDITRLVHLENVRRDFVANVSHELKTPITSIKGFVETLLDGALENPTDTKRFLQIISRQSDRLHSIFEDLLMLSRIEQEKGQITLQRSRILDVLKSAYLACEHEAQQKNVTVNIDCSKNLKAKINAPLLEQAIVNLISNAIKYSESDRTVLVSAKEEKPEIVIRVKDQGAGINQEHQDRLFERFYRVDRARSRKEGGTGLGLAIVKHIAQSHGGYPKVESTPEEGSTFSIHLPVEAS